MDWILLTYRLSSEPSRHRVAVWRELRKAERCLLAPPEGSILVPRRDVVTSPAGQMRDERRAAQPISALHLRFGVS
jgi:hypothetical protein